MLSVGEDGSVERLLDEDLKSTVLELKGASVATTSIQCPRQKLGPLRSLGITLPYMVFLVKNMEQPCSFEVQVLDSKNERRRFRASTFQVCDGHECCIFPPLLVVVHDAATTMVAEKGQNE